MIRTESPGQNLDFPLRSGQIDPLGSWSCSSRTGPNKELNFRPKFASVRLVWNSCRDCFSLEQQVVDGSGSEMCLEQQTGADEV